MRRDAPFSLSENETQALAWAARGFNSAQIAEILGTTKRNVDFYLDNARTKLGAVTRIHAVALAIQERLIEP